MYDASWIVGAMIYSPAMSDIRIEFNLGRHTICIIWDESGQIYVIDQYVLYKISSITTTGKRRFLDIFGIDVIGNSKNRVNHIIYNSVLSRIEDIYGMSISEFSLGLLEYA